MTPEAQIIAIAEACRWTKVHWYDGDNSGPGYWSGIPYFTEEEIFQMDDRKLDNFRRYGSKLPDYLTDLNAMHCALMSQTKLFRLKFETLMDNHCAGAGKLWCELKAEDFALVFLRALGKWVD